MASDRAASGLSARERRTVAIGAAVGALALLLAFGVLPYARRWQQREAVIAARREQLARLRGLERSTAALVTAARARESTATWRVLQARSAPLAASALQAAVQRWADESLLLVQRLDVAAAEGDSTGDAVPASLTAVGDLHGVADFLGRLRGGTVVEVREIAIAASSAAAGPREPLELSVTLRAPFALPTGGAP